MTEFKKLGTLFDELQEILDKIGTVRKEELSVGTSGISDGPVLERIQESTSGSAPEAPLAGMTFALDSLHLTENNAKELFKLLERCREIVSNAEPRMEKILSRAREKDPNKQLYNETMCKKIEVLGSRFFDDLKPVVPIFEQPVEEAYFEAVRLEAEQASWKERVANDLSSANEMEETSRVLILGEEKRTMKTLRHGMMDNFNRVLDLLEQKAKVKWDAEQDRRRAEAAALTKELKHGVTTTFGQQEEVIMKDSAAEEGPHQPVDMATRHAEALIQMGEEFYLLQGEMRSASTPSTSGGAAPVTTTKKKNLGLEVVKKLYELIVDIGQRPEAEEIRNLRNANSAFANDFGHPSAKITATSSDEGARSGETEELPFLVPLDDQGRQEISAAKAIALRPIYFHVEALLFSVGFRIAYTRLKIPPPAISKTKVPLESSLRFEWVELGFEGYGERLLNLREPNPMEDADAWMEWFNNLEAIKDGLEGVIRQGIKRLKELEVASSAE